MISAASRLLGLDVASDTEAETLASAILQGLHNDFDEMLHVEWLGEVCARADSEELVDLALYGFRADHDDGDVPRVFVFE